MAFIIENRRIEFEDYQKLDRYYRYPSVKPIIELLKVWNDPEVTHIEAKTSGSTGPPKTIQLSKDAIKKSCLKTQNYFKFESGEKALLCLPVDFIAGKLMVLRSIFSNLDLFIARLSSRPLESIDEAFAFVPMTPHQFGLSYKNDKNKLYNIKNILLGGAPISHSMMSTIDYFPAHIFHSYGMTETITHVAIKILNGKLKSDVFEALEGIKFDISKEDCLIINSDHLSETVVTNDIVELFSETTFRWVGRKDNIINSGGIKYFPEVLESKLKGQMRKRYFFSSQPDGILGEALILIIEGNESERTEIERLIQQTLNNKEQPKVLYFIEKFIETNSGKIDRNASIKLTLNRNNL